MNSLPSARLWTGIVFARGNWQLKTVPKTHKNTCDPECNTLWNETCASCHNCLIYGTISNGSLSSVEEVVQFVLAACSSTVCRPVHIFASGLHPSCFCELLFSLYSFKSFCHLINNQKQSLHCFNACRNLVLNVTCNWLRSLREMENIQRNWGFCLCLLEECKQTSWGVLLDECLYLCTIPGMWE